MIKYDFLIVGAGLFGSVCARELTDNGYKCLVIDKREHIGGNCYTENRDGINIHMYGPHIFHTSNERVWEYVNKYISFNNYICSPVANYKGEIYSLPFSMWTFSKMWGISSPKEAMDIIEKQSIHIQKTPSNLEEQAIKTVGIDVYNKLIKEYVEKQWKKSPTELPSQIIKRLPVRFTYDNNYFLDKYQGVPIGGYTNFFNKLLVNIDVNLGVDYLKDSLPSHNFTIYTGPIDKFYNYEFGELEYKSTNFVHKKMNTTNYQGTAIMSFTDKETIYTRIIEHKHFENSISNISWITYEYPIEYNVHEVEPHYPVNDDKNTLIYQNYKKMADKEKSVLFGGRLAEYKYYDMHQVIESALNTVDKILKSKYGKFV